MERPEIIIKHLDLSVGYGFVQESCSKCANSLIIPPPSTNKVINTTVVTGKCGHMYHQLCVNNQSKCLICKNQWDEKCALPAYLSY
jgi:hypothetical protein